MPVYHNYKNRLPGMNIQKINYKIIITPSVNF